jgi:coenzyme Q-binding protein COQ10
MPKASVKRSIKCTKEQLINLVLDIEKYPIFVPFCLDAKMHEKREQGDLLLIVADLTIGKEPFKDTYKSDVKFNKKEDSIYVTNLDGPLKYLENKWQFKEENKITEVSFEVDFELKNRFLNIVMTKSFQFGLDKIADAFQKRAENLFNKT